MIEEVFDNLVGQFNDPFTFYRELIQNSMDAGSNQVDVQVEYQADKERVVITVADSGEGMSEHIIREQLTRLFSSTKEDDFTKIGKFGIGFVSVFAIQPQLVMLDTGRDGEYWRVGFRGGTDYQLLRLEEPVEGTTIRLFKKMAAIDVDTFIARSAATISFWCKYSDTQVYFNGNLINEKLAVDSPLSCLHEQAGTTAVVGICHTSQPTYGLYNRGLTLMEGVQDNLPGISYRIKSHYLEHTLTRDNVIQDENYFKAMAILENVIAGELFPKLMNRLQELAVSYPEGADEFHKLLTESLTFLRDPRRSKLLKAAMERPLLPCLHSAPCSLKTLKNANFWEGSLYHNPGPNRVTEALEKRQIPVLHCEDQSPILDWVKSILELPIRHVEEVVAWPIVLAKQPLTAGWKDVCERIKALLALGKLSVQRVRLADFDYPGSCVRGLPCLAARDEEEPTRLYNRGFWRSFNDYPRVLLLNQNHALVSKALAKAEKNPGMSAFVLAKAALLQDGLPQDIEAKIVSRCWSHV